MSVLRPFALAFLVFLLLIVVIVNSQQSAVTSDNMNNFAVIVSTSRYWFNYRHSINALSFYHYLKTVGGYPDDRIVLMLADDYVTHPRNVFQNRMYSRGSSSVSLYNASSIEIDYRGDDVTADQFLQVLQGRKHDKHLPVLDKTNKETRLLIYITGHGGDQFIKFHDVHECMAYDLANAIEDLYKRGGYHSVLLMADTCQAVTLGDSIESPNVYVIGSSLKGESSYAHHSDSDLGLAVIERYTHSVMEYLKRFSLQDLSRQSLYEALVKPYSYAQQNAHIGTREVKVDRGMDKVMVTEFLQYHGPSVGAGVGGGSDDSFGSDWVGVPTSREIDGFDHFRAMRSFLNDHLYNNLASAMDIYPSTHTAIPCTAADPDICSPNGTEAAKQSTFTFEITHRETSDPVYLACLLGPFVMFVILSLRR
jgi:GPI-anchor transamidase subunit K